MTLKTKDLTRNFSRQALHSKSLKFLHPITNSEVYLECALPSDMEELICFISKKASIVFILMNVLPMRLTAIQPAVSYVIGNEGPLIIY
ncbi:MAG: hypothetical protein MTP17_01530 [Candidatus Midichloria sp.]|nr:MAG: hypothetical protein MTP17_01530 [Candidatus Midichloria sp.]